MKWGKEVETSGREANRKRQEMKKEMHAKNKRKQRIDNAM